MGNWSDLNARVAEKAQQLAAAELERKERDRLRQEYERWCAASVTRLMDQLFSELQRRAEQCRAVSGMAFGIRSPRVVQLNSEDPSRLVLTVTLNQDAVDLYVQSLAGAAPSLHLLLSRTRGGRALRLICMPGAWLSPTSDGGFELRSFDADQARIDIEDLCYRAVSLLALH